MVSGLPTVKMSCDRTAEKCGEVDSAKNRGLRHDVQHDRDQQKHPERKDDTLSVAEFHGVFHYRCDLHQLSDCVEDE